MRAACGRTNTLGWLGKLDAGTLKLKVAAALLLGVLDKISFAKHREH